MKKEVSFVKLWFVSSPQIPFLYLAADVVASDN